MGRNKVHILQIPKRQAPHEGGRVARVPTDLLFLLGLAVAFVLAHYSDKPPLEERPISIQRTEGPLVAENNLIGVHVIDSGLRGLER